MIFIMKLQNKHRDTDQFIIIGVNFTGYYDSYSLKIT